MALGGNDVIKPAAVTRVTTDICEDEDIEISVTDESEVNEPK